MTKSQTYKPIGGVARVALHSADAVREVSFASDGECAILFGDEATEVELLDDGSTFVEKITTDTGIALVRHTLSLVASRNSAEAWLDPDFLQRATRIGVIAEVVLNDGRAFVVGYSQHLTTEQPLRLREATISSGDTPLCSPTVTLCLTSTDGHAAAKLIQT
jgi:hypothetical protein